MVCIGCFILEIVVYGILILPRNVKIYIHSRIYNKYLKYKMCLGDLMRYFANLRHAKLNLWLMLWARFPDDILNLEFCCSFLLKKVFLCINLILPFFLYIIFILFILYLT